MLSPAADAVFMQGKDCYANIFRAISVIHIHSGHAPMKSNVLTANDDVPVATYTL